MGAQASRDAGADDPQSDELAAHAWRTGVPFTLLHDEGFVVEKYQELLTASGRAAKTYKAQDEAQTTASGLDEAPMDELRHPTDIARVKIFARKRRQGSSRAGGDRPPSPRPGGADTATASTSRDNAPSALAGMAGNVLSRESAESLDNEKLRAQRDELLQVYYEQFAMRMRRTHLQDTADEEPEGGTSPSEDTDPVADLSEEGRLLHGSSLIAEEVRIAHGASPASVFSVGSLRMQLEMLREFRGLSPRLFENGVMALVRTLLDSLPFVLIEVVPGSPEDVLLKDVHNFCKDMLQIVKKEKESLNSQSEVLLVLLLAIGVSSGRISLLLEFVDELLRLPRDTLPGTVSLLQGHSFVAWVDVFIERMQSYRVDFVLGVFEENACVKKFSLKALQNDSKDDMEDDTETIADSESAVHSLASDGSYLYSWRPTDGLVKIGTGLNFTVAGRVYAHVPAHELLDPFNEKRILQKLVYGFGDDVIDVSVFARKQMEETDLLPHSSDNSAGSVHDVFGALPEYSAFITPQVLISYCVDEALSIVILSENDEFNLPVPNARISRAWLGDLDVLENTALSKFRDQVGKSKPITEDEADQNGAILSRELLEELLILSNIPTERISNRKKLMVIFSSGDSNGIGAQLLGEGDRFWDVENRVRDSYLSSLVSCGDSLYLNLMYPDRDINGLLVDGFIHRSRQLLRISPQDLNLVETLALKGTSPLRPERTSTNPWPLYIYVTEGRRIYEIDLGCDAFNVNVVYPHNGPNGSKRLHIERSLTLDIKSVKCEEVIVWLSRIPNINLSEEGKLNMRIPSFYTNGSSLGMMLIGSSVRGDTSPNHCFHCVFFDCDSGQTKPPHGGSSSDECLERSLPLTSVCFDARNNYMWLYSVHKQMLWGYQNAGKRISLDDHCIPNIPTERQSQQRDFAKTTALSVLAFVYKNATANGSITPQEAENLLGQDRGAWERIPFAIDVDDATFQLLLKFVTSYVTEFESDEATLTQGYILQACLGILDKNLDKLLSLPMESHRKKMIGSLQANLIAPLDNLLQFSSEDSDLKSSEKEKSPTSSSLLDEKARVQVISVALDLYTTSIRIFHADIGKQLSHILHYLDLWQRSKATAMELKILSRLLAHVCTRVDAVYQLLVISEDAIKQFHKLVEIAMKMQQRQLNAVLAGMDEIGSGTRSRDEDPFELVSLVNAITQAVFVAVGCSTDDVGRRALDVGVSVFEILRDMCIRICSDVVEQLSQHDCHAMWAQLEKTLKDGFVGIIGPVVVSSGVSFMRNHKFLETLLTRNQKLASIKEGNNGSETDGKTAGGATKLGLSLSGFFKSNALQMQKFMASLDVLISMIDPAKKEHVVESVSTSLKTEIVESSHEYENNMDSLEELRVLGASRLIITFDPRSRTEPNYDYLTFYKDKSQGEFYGSQYYSGRDSEQNWPGVGDNPPLVIESDNCFVYFHTDGSNTDWGYRFTAAAEILERKKTLQQHWIVFLLESVVQLLDESIKLLVDGSVFAPIEELEMLNERFLQSDLLKSGVCSEDDKNAEVLQLLQDFVDPPESSNAEKVVNALLERSATTRPGLALARSTSFDQITNSAPNKCVNSAVRAVAAAILHHNMWGMDAYAFTQNLRNDISEQLLRGWKNAQKMRDWFHLGDAADAGIHGQMMPNRRRSGRLRRQPSAYKGLSEESLAILCDNVMKRAQFLLEITPVSFAYVTGAKRRWGLLAKYGHAIGKHSSSDSQLDKWYNLLDELQAATELRSLFQYRRSSSERLKHGQIKSVTEQVLEFIQSDVDVAEIRKVIETRNQRAASRALGIEIFQQTLKGCPTLRLKGILLESFSSTLTHFAAVHASSDLSDASPKVMSVLESGLPRIHFNTLLLGCDESLRQRLAGAFGSCLNEFSSLLSSVTNEGSNSALVNSIFRCCAIDYDLEDSYLLQESQILPQILRLLSSQSIPIRNGAQSLVGVLLSRFILGSGESGDTPDESEETIDGQNVSVFQQQLFASVGHQLENIVSTAGAALQQSTRDAPLPAYLPDNSPGLTSPCLQNNAVTWNHSIMLWVYAPKSGPLYALKMGDEVRRGPNWDEVGEVEDAKEVGTVVGIPSPTRVLVRWRSSGITSQCAFDPKNNIFEVVLATEGVEGVIFLKGNKTLLKDSAAAKPWSYFGLFLTDKHELVYKIACGSDKESVFETDYELDTDQWSHVAIVQDEDTLKVYVNGSMVSQHLLESFLVLNGNVNPAESAIIESAHPLEDSIDEYCPIHIPGAIKIRLTFDPLCDIDGSTGFVRFYKDAQCVEFWGEDKYTGKYSDPERNFPGAQSNRARSLQQAENGFDSNVSGMDILEIPSDRFLVYFHNEGSSNSWGFRILASPEFDSSNEARTSSTSQLNPYPFYFGEPPGRVIDESAARCWIYQPKVLGYPISEDDLTVEIQEAYPAVEGALNCISKERTLHVLGLIQTCVETTFGRSLISTPTNVKHLMVLSLGDQFPIEIRIGATKILKDLAGYLDPQIVDSQFTQAFSSKTTGNFTQYVFCRLAYSLNVWRMFNDDNENYVAQEQETGAIMEQESLPLRSSAQGEASLAKAYVSLLRSTAQHSSWSNDVSDLIKSGLRSFRDWEERGGSMAEDGFGQVLASLAILGGSYGGAYLGGRVSCCVNVDGKEMVETGYLVQFLLKNSVHMARIVFDCDQSSTVDVPLTDVAHLDDEEQTELECLVNRLSSSASDLMDLYHYILSVDTDIYLLDDSYEPKLTKKENVEVLESEHPYAAGEDVTYLLNFRGANEIIVQFDKMSCTAGPNDFVQFKKRKADCGKSDSDEYWGAEKYYGDSFPGVGTVPPLRILAGSVEVHFSTEGTANTISEWGFKLTAHAFEETLVYPPETPPSIRTSALNDTRARCVKSLGKILQSRKNIDFIPNIIPLLPSLARIANAPTKGRPIQAPPKSQIFESKHPYANSVVEYMKVTFAGASALTITFDPQSRTEQGCDYLCFFKDKSLTERWGAYQYCGVGSEANWPGIDDRPPLVIPADSFTLLWNTDGSNVDWGWKFNVTAEFLPEFPLDRSLSQLDARSYRLFETLYEKMNYQRLPLKTEFEEFEKNNEPGRKPTDDPIRQLLSSCATSKERALSAHRMCHKQILCCVTDDNGVSVFCENRLDSDVIVDLDTGTEFVAEMHQDGWLKVTSVGNSEVGEDGKGGWVWQRTSDTLHVTFFDSYENGEDLLVLGIDDLNFEIKHSVLEMNESNDEEKSLSELCSPFAFDDFKGQMDRVQSMAYDSHRAMATKAARDAILSFLSCDPKRAPVSFGVFGEVDEILILLSSCFFEEDSDGAYDNQSDVLQALRTRLAHTVLSNIDDGIISKIIKRCMEILQCCTAMLPVGRGAVRIVESTHPYQDNMDQYWEISIPGAKRIKVVFDRRSKSEAGCDWLRFYKAGSNRTETIGPDQIGGRLDSENWPGTGDRPPLYIEADSFEVYFHSDSSNTDWGFKLYAIGIYKEETSQPEEKNASTSNNAIVKLLSVACWVLESLSTIPEHYFRESSTAFNMLYSAEMVETLMTTLKNSPQSIKTCALQILSNMSQCAAFRTLPVMIIEQLRDLVNIKMRAKYQSEDRVELKSPYLQKLLQCAIAVDLALDSHCFDQCIGVKSIETEMCLHSQPKKNGWSTFVSDSNISTSGCYQFMLSFKTLVAPVNFGFIDESMSSNSSSFFLQWNDEGKAWFKDKTGGLVEVIGYDHGIHEGDVVVVQLDTRNRTLVVRKNNVVTDLVAGPEGAHALIPWEKICLGDNIRVLVSYSHPDNQIKFNTLQCSPLALIPSAVVPNWYNKIVDAVGMMLDFRDNRSSTIILKESRHPLSRSADFKPICEDVRAEGAIAFEIKFDKRTKLRSCDELCFSCVDDSKVCARYLGLNGDVHEKADPNLFVADSTSQPNLPLSVGDLVIRSLDWEYSDEDGGSGNVGVVTEVASWGQHGGKGLRVQWQANGYESVYRYGLDGRYDVESLKRNRYQNSPLIIEGNSFSYEFKPGSAQSSANLDLSNTIPEFVGSLELNGSSSVLLGLVEEHSPELFRGDCSVELWVCVAEDIFVVADDQPDVATHFELLRIGGNGVGRIAVLIDRSGKCVLEFQIVDESDMLVECRQYHDTMSSSENLMPGQWMHLALVFCGPSVSVFKNGDAIFTCRCAMEDRIALGLTPSFLFGQICALSRVDNSLRLPFRGHLFDVRVWDVALRVEQLRSHFRGLDSVDVVPKTISRPGTPTSGGGKPLSPSLTYTSSPRSPRSSMRAPVVPPHVRKWVTTNRTNKKMSTIRLNCCVKMLTGNEAASIVYYEAHSLSSGNFCVGWISEGTNMFSCSVQIGEERNSYGIELGKKLAHLSGHTQDLEPFSEVESTGCTSPRRSFGGGSFTNDVFCRNGDVIGCAINLATQKLSFFVNGTLVAECVLPANGQRKSIDTADASVLLSSSNDREFDALVSEIIAVGKVVGSHVGSNDSVVPAERDVRGFFPSASLGSQGAQGLAWNFGQRPFKYESSLGDAVIMSVLEASKCSEDDAHFEVYEHDEHEWSRIVYRHKLQDITPRLAGWWKLNEGVGNTLDDASGNDQLGLIVFNHESGDKKEKISSSPKFEEHECSIWWDEDCCPPAVARRRAGEGNNGSPFFSIGSTASSSNKAEAFWGYKFYVIPHFSADTIGRRRFQSPLLRFGESPRKLSLRHDQQLVKYVNKKGQSKGLSVTQLLHAPWSDIAPQENELVRWPALVEVVTSIEDGTVSLKEGAVEPGQTTSRESNAPALSKSTSDGHNRLSRRFKLLQEFNTAIHRILPLVAFHVAKMDLSDIQENHFLLSHLVMEQRYRIFSVVKRTVWDNALGRTNETGASFELTLNRPKAMRFRAAGKTDAEGRHTLFSQAFRQLQSLDGSHFRREDALYHVTFLGENAQDAGGPYRETFAQYCEELQSNQLPLMLPTPNSQHNVGVGREKWLLNPGALSTTAIQMFEFLGRLMGTAVRSKQYLALNLAPLVWKRLAGEHVSVDDLAAVDSMLVNSMSKMRTIDRLGVTEEMFEDIVMETFTTLGADNRTIELKPGGASLAVTFKSRCEYANLVEHARLHESDVQVQAIFQGLAKVLPAKLLACFSGSELELMVCGSPEINVDLLEKCTEYSSCSPTDDHIIWFWRTLREFSHEERSAFLRFVWGRSRLPSTADEFPQRFKLQSFNQQRAGRSVDAYMPVAHTCFFSVEIPAYTSEAILREKLLYAIYNCQEIDGDGDSVAANQLGWEE